MPVELAGGSVPPELGVWGAGGSRGAAARPSGTVPVPLPPGWPSPLSQAALSAAEKGFTSGSSLSDLLEGNEANKVHG